MSCCPRKRRVNLDYPQHFKLWLWSYAGRQPAGIPTEGKKAMKVVIEVKEVKVDLRGLASLVAALLFYFH